MEGITRQREHERWESVFVCLLNCELFTFFSCSLIDESVASVN